MAEFIEQAVQEIRESPDSGEPVQLILGIQESHISDVSASLEDLGVDSIEKGPFNTLRVETTEDQVPEITQLDYLEDIEIDSKGRMLAQGN